MSKETMEITVGMGEIRVAESPHLLKVIGVGSCLAVALYDRHTSLGGLAHVLLPCVEESQDKSDSTRFTDVAIRMLVEEMKGRGAQVQDIKAKIFGGANMFPEIIQSESAMDIGKRNVLAAKEQLKKHNIQIVASEVGDHIGRTVVFDTRDGSVIVRSASSEERKY
jgi:chemotaxis protein CheD